ncbi:Plant regulator RWP-RK family protein [Rhynchospora pubera]|uniref:Plant regulator RWP-RK family protein n=1 Tax=Rhynchospora pubera TaxID=906938 RepID=A0AAV8CCT6_9POAL|nr:Plant regulator RWP-RK family protein [Rhynchospora pubera]KAJ4794394.1 Plant regulator RWP-RK family protein [Rhynchospora pubera]
MASPLPDSFLGQPLPSPSLAAGVAAASPSKPKLTLDDITRLFNIPITEAASILGVSTSVLKRLCRKNGIARWPYRQLLSGKTIDDIKKEAEIERRKLQKEREEMGKRKTDSSKTNSAVTIGSFKTIGDQNRMAPGQALQQGSRIIGPQVDPFSPMKNIPTYLDEFKFGFPSTGLSTTSNKWWGSEETDPEKSSVKETDPEKSSVKESSPKQSSIKESDSEQSSVKVPEPEQSSVKESDPEQSSVKEVVVPKNPFERLVALRRRAVEESRALMEGKGNKVIESCSLNKKQKTALLQVFGSSLPDEWKSVVS